MTIHQVYKQYKYGCTANRHEYTDEWYTPRLYVDAAREVMGDIDLAPAGCAEAAKVTGIANYYSRENSGLDNSWHGRVWCNPPYERKLMLAFAKKFVEQKPNIQEAIILVSAKPDTRWSDLYLNHCNAVCYHKGRIKFVYGPDPEAPTEVNPHGTAFYYFGPNVDAFKKVFSRFGKVARLRGNGWGGSRNGAGRKPGSISPTSERQSQPWKALGISPATYYRRKAEGLL
jgi:DNA N-6-adenine-methyltransferase (Dam)